MKFPRLFLGCAALLLCATSLLAADTQTFVTPRVKMPAAFQVPLPIPPTLTPTSSNETTDFYNITMQVGQKEIIPGVLTTIWGYNGHILVRQFARAAAARQSLAGQ
jgi:spore coat protein A